MKITERNLRELLRTYEQKAEALRLILADATGLQRQSKRQQGGSVLQQAIALDAERRNGGTAPKRIGRPPKKGGRTSSKRGYGSKETVTERRQRGANFLAAFSRTEPRQLGEHMGIYVNRGYLVRKGDGYVRTGKEFVV